MDEKTRFIKNIKKIFPLYGRNEKLYLKRFISNISEYDEDHPGSSYDVLVEKFGTPKEIYLNYLENQEEDYLIKKVRIRSIVQKTCIICITVFLLLKLWNGYLLFRGYQETATQDITEIELTESKEE